MVLYYGSMSKRTDVEDDDVDGNVRRGKSDEA